MKRLSQTKIISKFIGVHSNKYDYSEVIYTSLKSPVKIKCPVHGVFCQQPALHLRGCGCQECYGKRKLTLNDIKERSIKIYGDIFDFSIAKYTGLKNKMKIICPNGHIFNKIVDDHLRKKGGCPICKGYQKTTKIFIKDAIVIHGNKYMYIETVYILAKEKVKIICKKHGTFEQSPNDHLSGYGCPNCARPQLTTQDIIKRFKKAHGDKYLYNLVAYKNYTSKVKIGCKKHGTFEQLPASHAGGSGCPDCANETLESSGARLITEYLIEKNIKYVKEFRFEFCKDSRKLPFDFYLPDYHICIEYDGRHHYKAIDYFGGQDSFEKQRNHDTIKNIFCLVNQIDLIRIPYFEKNIKKVLDQKINLSDS